ncbi:MAG: proline dehydrogenase family protein [Gemmatimonadota bacterium]
MLRSLLLRASRSGVLEHQFRQRSFSRRALSRFMPGEDLESAMKAAEDLRDHGIGTVFTRLGEEVKDAGEADGVVAHYVDVLEKVDGRALDTQISVKPTQLGLALGTGQGDTVDGFAVTRRNLERLARTAAAHGNFVWVDMEGSEYTDATVALVREVRARHENVGLCLQAYLRRTPADVEVLRDPPTRIRLVKGAYREPASIAFPRKRDVDAAYMRISDRLMSDDAFMQQAPPVFATHDVVILDNILARAASNRIPREHIQVNMLYGIRRETQLRMAASGITMRTLISYGSAWYPWYVRRLAERPANLWFVAKSVIRS